MKKYLPFLVFIAFLSFLIVACESDCGCEDDKIDGDAESEKSETTNSDGDKEILEKEQMDSEKEIVEQESIEDGDKEQLENEKEVDASEGENESVETDTDSLSENTDVEMEEDQNSCSGSCDPNGAMVSYCITDRKAKNHCICDSKTNSWIERDCDKYCKSEGFTGSNGCGFLLSSNDDGCICLHDCSNSTVVKSYCDDTSGAISVYNNCTCAKSDPCGWDDNDFCDRSVCAMLYPENFFSDSKDCDEKCDNPTEVQAWCNGSTMNNCTCDKSDQCNWSDNGVCDFECSQMFPDNHFVDLDCK